jgi:hypothetical protein
LGDALIEIVVAVLVCAEQLAVVPPSMPAQVQVHGPLPLTALGVPAVHRLVGVRVRTAPLSLPQTPFTGVAITLKLAITVQSAVIAFVVYTVPLRLPPHVPPTLAR